MDNERIIQTINKFLDDVKISDLINNNQIKSAIKLTIDNPYFSYKCIVELIKLFLQEGYKLTDLFEKPQININKSNVLRHQLDEKTFNVSIKYMAEVISDQNFNLFMTMVNKVKYKKAKANLWVYAPTNYTPYAEVVVYCDPAWDTKQVTIKDVTDIVFNNYMLSAEVDRMYDPRFTVTKYDIKGRSKQVDSLIQGAIDTYIDEYWHTIFEKNDYEKLGIIL